MKKKDLYEILGVDRKASVEQIKKKYRELAKKHHPDANQGSKKSESIFKSITAAYEILKDKKKRQAYDRRDSGDQYQRGWQTGESHEHAHRQGWRSGRQSSERTEPQYNPDSPTRGFDLQFMIDVPLVTTALGGKMQYTFEKPVTCPACGGTGQAVSGKCGNCKGKRQIQAPVTLEIHIPAGVADQFTLRVENQGGAGKNGGPPGDLLLKINVQPHPKFKRVKNDIFAKIVISKSLAKAGGFQDVQTLDSVRVVPVEEGTLTGEEYRLPGEGAMNLCERKRGDFIIKFFVSDN